MDNNIYTINTLFEAGAFSEALLPSKPSWTKSSNRRTNSSFISVSPCRFAAIFANALITAPETCLVNEDLWLYKVTELLS